LEKKIKQNSESDEESFEEKEISEEEAVLKKE
jgi:hypothetical protein